MLSWEPLMLEPTYSEYSAMRKRLAHLFGPEADNNAFTPYKLSMSLVGALRALRGGIAGRAEECCARWHQFVVCSRRAGAETALAASHLDRIAPQPREREPSHVFFVSRKVNRVNAP